jgi:mannose-6-phosphate isomerase-like protein (cupin superfamily)
VTGTSETDETTVPVVQMAKDNDEFRRVVMTGDKMQVVLMAIPAGQEIGAETHDDHDQVLVFVAGSGRAEIGGSVRAVAAGDLSFVRAGVRHNFVNDGEGPLKLYTMYAPPEHAAGTEHRTKAEADAAEA